MKITELQIESLYLFTRQHYVEHYDLQTELVDHLANDIESLWQENPNLSFMEARDLAFKKFGVFGFMDVVDNKLKAMNKRYAKILWNFGKEWFALPKISITIVIFFVFLICFSSEYGSYFIYGVTGGIIIYSLVKFIELKRRLKLKRIKTGRVWLLEDLIFNAVAMNILFLLIYIRPSSEIIESIGFISWTSIGFALFFTLATVYSYISLNVLPAESEKLLNDVYPEYKMV